MRVRLTLSPELKTDTSNQVRGQDSKFLSLFLFALVVAALTLTSASSANTATASGAPVNSAIHNPQSVLFAIEGASPSATSLPTGFVTPSSTITPSPTTGTVTATPTCVPQGTYEFITMYNNNFSPRNVTVLAGTRVLWTNNNDHSYAHTTTSDNALWDSGPLNDGQQFGYTFYTPGTYSYHCSIHAGMTGSVIVNPATPCSTATSTTIPPSPTGTPQAPTVTSTAVPSSTAVTTPTSTPCAINFTDVDESNVFYTFIRCLACRGIIGGYDDGTFRPFNDITRGQIAKIVSNAAGFSEDPGPQVYEDVPMESPFYQWINRLSMRGHMGGYECGLLPQEPCVLPNNLPYFRPSNSATRGQLAKIVSNAAGIGGDPTGLYYTDVPEDHTFYPWIMRLTLQNVMSGYPCGGEIEPCDEENRPYFRPFSNVTRGQASKIVANSFYPGSCDLPNSGQLPSR
jgi:plastocyanin